jgi:hypothetical protein
LSSDHYDGQEDLLGSTFSEPSRPDVKPDWVERVLEEPSEDESWNSDDDEGDESGDLDDDEGDESGDLGDDDSFSEALPNPESDLQHTPSIPTQQQQQQHRGKGRGGGRGRANGVTFVAAPPIPDSETQHTLIPTPKPLQQQQQLQQQQEEEEDKPLDDETSAAMWPEDDAFDSAIHASWVDHTDKWNASDLQQQQKKFVMQLELGGGKIGWCVDALETGHTFDSLRGACAEVARQIDLGNPAFCNPMWVSCIDIFIWTYIDISIIYNI